MPLSIGELYAHPHSRPSADRMQNAVHSEHSLLASRSTWLPFCGRHDPRGTLRRVFYQGFYACCIPACLGSLLPSLKNVCAWKRAAKTPSSSASCGQHLLGSVQKSGAFRCSSRSLSRALQPSSGTVVPLLSCPARIPVFLKHNENEVRVKEEYLFSYPFG